MKIRKGWTSKNSPGDTQRRLRREESNLRDELTTLNVHRRHILRRLDEIEKELEGFRGV